MAAKLKYDCPTRRTSLRIPETLYTQLEANAKQQNRPVSEVINTMLATGLEKRSRVLRTEPAASKQGLFG